VRYSQQVRKAFDAKAQRRKEDQQQEFLSQTSRYWSRPAYLEFAKVNRDWFSSRLCAFASKVL